jgi:hypothetical protein
MLFGIQFFWIKEKKSIAIKIQIIIKYDNKRVISLFMINIKNYLL